jgi:hypothetical protein
VKQARLKKIKTEVGARSLGEVTVEQAIGGMRGIPVRWRSKARLGPS